MFKKILIANRGEIALRLLRACHEMGLETVTVHSTADHDAMHVRLAHESICIGKGPSSESYLNMKAILSAATITGVDAIHPGVGFLSENGAFAEMVQEHGFAFIGPHAHHIHMMGDKITAKKAMERLGIPVVPGLDASLTPDHDIHKLAQDIGYPVLVKASGGGGGKGMKIVKKPEELEESIALAQQEAQANFGNNQVFMEKFLENPRHIEVQVLGDTHGHAIHLGERDCSLQRRHQKVWEEALSPALTDDERKRLGTMVAQATKDLGYVGAGTFEFLYEKGQFYFIEMNTRLQVEHPITEMVTGIDLVKEQIRIAQGMPLSYTQEDVNFQGHAIECRINAEDPRHFTPSPGAIKTYHAPGGLGVRVDSHLYTGYRVPPYYDSLISKLIVHDVSREACLKRLERALSEYVIEGISTLIPLHMALCQQEDIQKGVYTIRWLENFLEKASF